MIRDNRTDPKSTATPIASSPIRLSVDRALAHLLLVSLGLVLLYGWMARLPFYADSLYLTTSQVTVSTPWHVLAAFDPRIDLVQNESTRVVPLYRPVSLELAVPLLQNLGSPLALHAVGLALVLATALVIYGFSFWLSRCQDSAFVVAAFFAFHPALFESFLLGFAGLGSMLTYCLVALALLVCRRFGVYPSWPSLMLMLSLAGLAVFAWERVLLLPLGLALLALGWRLFDRRLAGPDNGVSLMTRLRNEVADPRFLGLLGGALVIMAAYSLARVIRYGALITSHYGFDVTVSGALRQATALVLAAVGLVPPVVPPWLGVHFGRMPLAAQIGLLAYSVLVVWLVVRSLRARPALAGLGLVLGGLLILPTFSASRLMSFRYADFLVVGLTVTLSVAPLFGGASSRQRLARSLAIVMLMAIAAATHEMVQLNTPKQWPDHFLTRSARLADTVQKTVEASDLLPSGRPVLLLSSFFNHEEQWIFNATASRLGSFFSANFGIPREQVIRFTPDRWDGQAAVVLDRYYRVRQGAMHVVAAVSEVRGIGLPQTIEHAAQPFVCTSGSMLIIHGRRRGSPGGNPRQYIRVAFSGADESFNPIQLFSPGQKVISHGDDHETRVYAMVPPGANRCQVVPEGLESGARISDVQLLPLVR